MTVEKMWTTADASECGDHDIDHDHGNSATVSSRVESPSSAPEWKWSSDYLSAVSCPELGVAKVLGDGTPAASPTPGPATKGDTLKDFFSQRAGEWGAIEAENPPTRPRATPSTDPTEALAETAAHFKLTPAQFVYALNHDLTHLDKWHALACSTDDGDLLPSDALPVAETATRPFPAVPKPADRAAPSVRAAPDVVGVPPLQLWPEFRQLSADEPIPSHLHPPPGGWPPFVATFSLWDAFKVPGDAKRRVAAWQAGIVEDARRMRAAKARGDPPKSGFRKVEVFGPEEFLPFVPGQFIEVKGPPNDPYGACSFRPHADEPVATNFSIDAERILADMGGGDFPDQELVHALTYGTDPKSDSQPWGLVLSPMNASAAAELDVLEKTLDNGLDPDGVLAADGSVASAALDAELRDRAGLGGTDFNTELARELRSRAWLNESTNAIQSVPGIYEPYGIAYKKHSLDPISGKPKPRQTNDKSGPHNVTISGKPVAENEHVDLKVDHPLMTLITATGIRRAIDVLAAISREAQAGVRASAKSAAAGDEAARHLEVFMASDDMKSYFSQFVVALKTVHRNGMAFPRRDGTVSFSQSKRMQFGGATSPSWSQRLTNTIMARLSTLMAEEEKRFEADATDADPDPSALLASPHALRDVLGRRATELADSQEARASWGAGYIDDMM